MTEHWRGYFHHFIDLLRGAGWSEEQVHHAVSEIFREGVTPTPPVDPGST